MSWGHVLQLDLIDLRFALSTMTRVSLFLMEKSQVGSRIVLLWSAVKNARLIGGKHSCNRNRFLRSSHWCTASENWDRAVDTPPFTKSLVANVSAVWTFVTEERLHRMCHRRKVLQPEFWARTRRRLVSPSLGTRVPLLYKSTP